MQDVPFAYRILLLCVVLGILAAWDRARHGAAARRGREYALLLLCGALGGGIGVAQDLLVSVRLSPEFFELAKGIEPGPGFLTRVAELGFHAGFMAGALAGGILLLLNQPRPERRALSGGRVLALAAATILPLAVLGALSGAWLVEGYEPGWVLELAGYLGPEPAARLRTVWGIHAGLYAGATLGLVGAGVAVWRARLTPADTAPAPAA